MKSVLLKRIICLLLAGSLILAMTGCQKKNSNSGDDVPKDNTEKDIAADNLDQNLSEGATADNQSEAGKDEAKKEPSMPYEEYEKKYKAFIDNDEPVYFSWFLKSGNLKYSNWEYSGYENSFKSSSAYVFSDFIENICSAYSEQYDSTAYPECIYYSIIDCGNDGEPELVVNINGIEDGTTNGTDTWFIKYMDNKLQLIQFVQSGYRSQLDIGEYGYYDYGGSNGAASWCIEHAYIGADSLVRFDFGEENTTSVWSFYVADNSEYQTVAEEEGIEDNIEVEQFYFDKHDLNEEYADFQKNSMWIYYKLDYKYSRIEDSEIYKDGNPYKVFWDSTGLSLNTEDEIEAAKKAHRAEMGITEEILKGAAPKWTKMSDKQLETIYQWKPPTADVTVLEEPSWEYYCHEDAESVSKLKIEVENKTPNEIIDENVWFAAMGMEEPDRLTFSDEKYTYVLYGDDAKGYKWYPYMMDICQKDTDIPVYTLDFSNYYKPEEIKVGDDSFVEEAIHWAVCENDILYVSTYHNTYASSAPQNGYITALDMKNGFRVLWRTKPLTCNSSNFLVTDDAIICGYGFTAEDDFVYVLDKKTGERISQTKVKTSPEWFCINGEQLFVRCYDTDYVFNMVK